MNLYKAGMVELIPDIFEKSMLPDERELFIQYLIFHDIKLVKELLPKMTGKLNQNIITSIKTMGEDSLFETLNELKLCD